MTIADAIDLFLQSEYYRRGFPLKMFRNHPYAPIIRCIGRYFGMNEPLEIISHHKITDWLSSPEYLLARNGAERAPAALSQFRSIFRKFLQWAQASGHMVVYPLPEPLNNNFSVLPRGRAAQNARLGREAVRPNQKRHAEAPV